MRTDIINILYGLLLGMMLASCATKDDVAYDVVQEPTEPEAKQVDLLVSIGDRAMKHRQSPVLSHRAPTFQGMEQLVAIPYRTNNTPVAVTDEPLIDLVGATEADNTNYVANDHSNYYVDRCHLMTTTNRMLVYGKSLPAHNDESYDPTFHGKLSNLSTQRTKTENITFSLSSIQGSTTPLDEAKALATYMTNIANTPNWSTTENPTLKSYYMDFIRFKDEGGGLMSGAAANIKEFVAALKDLLTGDDDLSKAIKNRIDANSSITSNTYPRSIGLPDGAAVIRWTGTKFEVRTTTTTLDNINGIDRYTYPAELVFFTDSPIWTSAIEVSKGTYQNMNTSWATFLGQHYTGPAAVNTETKAVAVENPLQYGVANLQLTLTGMSTSTTTLKDAEGKTVATTDMSTLPLTGVIIGGQHTVGHNMKPRGEQTDVDGRFIYETHINSGNSISTLVLQSYDNEKVPVILELENKTGDKFTGKDGTVYPNTRFYLIGLIDPTTGVIDSSNTDEDDDCDKRVFTMDHTTTISMSVSSLANAYTSMPDLLAPRLEVGVQVVTKWIQATTTNVEL